MLRRVLAVALMVVMGTTLLTGHATAAHAADTMSTRQAQERLHRLRYYFDDIDGIKGPRTTAAVVAFQKVHGLARDGVIGPKTSAALRNPKRPRLRGTARNRVEVDLTKQVAYVVRRGRLRRIVPVSSGNGETYDGYKKANTPVGKFRVQRKIRGERHAELGTLYDPLYFYGGYALHGSNSVPSYEASHGCVRLNRWGAVWLFDRAPVGMRVKLYEGRYTFRPQ